MLKADLHNHSVFSHDALTKPSSFIKNAVKKGLDAIAITDHNTIQGWEPVLKEAKARNFSVILGEEIKVFDGKKSAGEIIGLFLNELVSPGQTGEVLDAIKIQGGISVIAHPFDLHRNPFLCLKEFAKKTDAIEVFNARTLSDSANNKAKDFAEKNGLVGVCGSDSHTPFEIGNAFVKSNSTDLEELRKDIIKGKSSVNGKNSGVWVHAFSIMAKTGLFPSL